MITKHPMTFAPRAYHDDKLLVRLAPDYPVGPVVAAAASRGSARANIAAAVEMALPGLEGFLALERSGMVKSIVPVSRRAAAVDVRGVARAVAAVASRVSAGERAAGGSALVELTTGRGLDESRRMLASDPAVQSVSLVPIRYAMPARKAKATPAKRGASRAGARLAAPSAGSLWNLQKIRWAAARALPIRDASAIRVAVLDTGIQPDHPDLRGQVKSYVFEHDDIPVTVGDHDIVGHGTHVAGTIAALINNRVGIQGICDPELHIWKIFSDEAEFDRDASFSYFVHPLMYLRALTECVDEEIDVINLSIGGPGAPSREEEEAFTALLQRGTTIVAAMGNEREINSPTSYPAAIEGVIAVGATSINDSVAEFSNRGSHISLCAPGKAIWSTLPTYDGQFGFEAVIGTDGRVREGKAQDRETDYDAWDGTSMASPHVAAAAALLLANKGTLTPAQVKKRLEDSADRVPGMGSRRFHPDFGRGRLNLLRLLR